ncbi:MULTISPECIES: GNAT family N-acetyltransferase [unclassified Moraxella]|uniref:GNAT family N-acetyltransferase n=1 Tax=unclassified Moraxella TaxID=2685852 RepID=UPI003AF775C8
MHHFNIKPLKAQDKQAWLVLWQGYLDFYQTTLPQTTIDSTWQRIIDEHSPIFGFGAWHHNALVGFVHVVLHPNTWNTTDCCYLEDLYVSDSVRGKGVGRQLIEFVYDFAKQKDCNRVYWVTNKTNITAQRLYDKVAKKMDFIQYRYNIE